MVKRPVVQQYLASEKQLTLLSGKRPIVDNWTSKKINKDKILKHKGNLGWVIGEDDLVIDVDPRNGGDKSFDTLVKVLGIELEPTVITPSGGFYVYLYIPAIKVGIKLKKTLKEFPGIDFLTKGSQCVIVGSSTEVGSYTWVDDLFGEFKQSRCDTKLIEVLSNKNKKESDKDLGDFKGLIVTIDKEDVVGILEKSDPDVEYDGWIKIGMMLKDWHQVDGLELWDQWSQLGTKYIDGECKRKWLSFENKPGGLTSASLYHVANEVGYEISGDNANKPDWCNRWIYIDSQELFYDTSKCVMRSARAFNMLNDSKVPTGPRGGSVSADKFVSKNDFIEHVDSLAFLPTIKDQFAWIDKCRVLNCFNPNTIPPEALEHTDDGVKAIKIIKRHIKLICSNKQDSRVFLQWLAHQVQYPGKKIPWAPIIQSIPGVGKSFFGELLRSVIGDRNVGTVNPMQVSSNFNGWATNVVVNVLEELRVRGHNRYEVVNALKPLITDRMIQINEKSVKPYMTYNTANYICFTNDREALPMDEIDRRWWVIFVDINNLDEIGSDLNLTKNEYFDQLFDSMRNHAGEIRKWFLEYPISKEFEKTRQAPMTYHKQAMVTVEESAFEGLDEVREIIVKGGKYIDSGCISQSDLNEIILFEYPTLDLNRNQIRKIMMKLGYHLRPNKIKIDGKSKWIWLKTYIDNEKVRNIWNLEPNSELKGS